MIANAKIADALMVKSTSSTIGAPSTTMVPAAISDHRASRIRRWRRSASGSGRTSSAPRHELSSSLSRRAWLDGCTSNTTKMTSAMIGYAAAGVSELNRTPASSSPRAVAAIAIVGSRSSRPMTIAARQIKSCGNAAAYPTGTPMMPLRKNRATNDIAAAIPHTRVFNLLTGMPSIAARSPRSALARTARP